ncbi:MAG: bifunctional DNA-binding transcriptional regulator/O6-methylguanine-DNA methyltransferase Ada [Chloroflexi bacterium]|nr:bifunctional DNA-binding transcriptional regulator/O6-methylguanine-DNA methyltransferase Ada [Chloroflexota bacterium]
MSDADRWQAVLDRDARFDGAFVMAVRTTGIYCRPSCPARHPRRENVHFYACPADAERDGFRPCKRCSPNTQAFEAAVVQQVCAYLETHLDENPRLADLGWAAGLSPQHLQRVFKRALGISPRQYADARRLERLKARLKEGRAVTDALYEVGYSSSSRLYERAPGQLGMTPAVYRRGGQDMDIRYTVEECPLGWLLVAATERGVCAVSLGDTPAYLEGELRADYPAAAITRDEGELGAWVKPLLRHLDGQQPHLELPLDVRATAFQRRVWQALQAIPAGETRTYSQIAASIGSPKAARAVGSACAHNPVSLLIPCHRAVREDGSLGGYRWGLARKAALLERERRENT